MAVEQNILVLTPVAPGTVLAPYALGLPRLVSELAPSVKVRERNININRARLQSIFVTKYFPKYEYVLLLDSDVVVSREAVNLLLKAWTPDTTPCACTKEGNGGHVVCSCALVHRTDYEKVDYLSEMMQCQCMKLPHPFYVDGAKGYEV